MALVCTNRMLLYNVPANPYSGWGVPFVWVGIWTAIAIPWIRRDMHRETITWEEDAGIVPEKKAERAHEAQDSHSEEPRAQDKEPEREPEP